ncbi:hypothetical protein HGRIS_005190 [Hohenbuehelia grisea]|uniref:F-box domain-containing protein n=1 Tax=Hohenbuehelia grisea TaxID=104357 RepID=A0ABR3JEQ3_9AGAR
MSSTPQEILDMIVSHSKSDDTYLQNASLVCRSWALASQRHLFRRLRLATRSRVHKEDDDSDPAAFFAESPHLAAYVRELDINVGCCWDTTHGSRNDKTHPEGPLGYSCILAGNSAITAELLSKFPNVQRLELWGEECEMKLDVEFAPEFLKAVQQVVRRPLMKHLVFEGFNFKTKAELDAIVDSIDHPLALIELTSVSVGEDFPVQPPSSGVANDGGLVVDTFRLQSSPLHSAVLWFEKLKNAATIRSLVLTHNMEVGRAFSIERFLTQIMPAGLQSLEFSTVHGFALGILDLGKFRSLRSLAIILEVNTSNRDDEHKWDSAIEGRALIAFIKNIEGPSLMEHIKIHKTSVNMRNSLRDNTILETWTSLDDILAGSAFPHLKTLELGLIDPSAWHLFEKAMPLLKGKGVLRLQEDVAML